MRSADLRRRIGNAILPEAATAHVEELSDPYLLWFWNSNVRSTAIVLNSLVKADARRHAVPRARRVAAPGAQGRTLGQHAGERARARGARRLLPQVRVGDARTSPRSRDSARRSSRSRAVPGALDRGARPPTCRWRAAGLGPGGIRSAADVHAHRHRDAVLLGAPALRRGSSVPAGLDQGIRVDARPTRPTSRTARVRRRRRSRPAISSASR